MSKHSEAPSFFNNDYVRKRAPHENNDDRRVSSYTRTPRQKAIDCVVSTAQNHSRNDGTPVYTRHNPGQSHRYMNKFMSCRLVTPTVQATQFMESKTMQEPTTSVAIHLSPSCQNIQDRCQSSILLSTCTTESDQVPADANASHTHRTCVPIPIRPVRIRAPSSQNRYSCPTPGSFIIPNTSVSRPVDGCVQSPKTNISKPEKQKSAHLQSSVHHNRKHNQEKPHSDIGFYATTAWNPTSLIPNGLIVPNLDYRGNKNNASPPTLYVPKSFRQPLIKCGDNRDICNHNASAVCSIVDERSALSDHTSLPLLEETHSEVSYQQYHSNSGSDTNGNSIVYGSSKLSQQAIPPSQGQQLALDVWVPTYQHYSYTSATLSPCKASNQRHSCADVLTSPPVPLDRSSFSVSDTT